MSRKLIAVIIISIVVVAGASTAVIIILNNRGPNETQLHDSPSEFEGQMIIYEVKPSSAVNEEYVELYCNGEIPNTQGWILTTYDNDRIVLPKISEGGSFTYIRILSRVGANDLNSSDNQVTIFANQTTPFLNLGGDEIGLHDAEGYLIDFFRYSGGNGDGIKGIWSDDDMGPATPSEDKSLSLIGSFEDRGVGEYWMDSPQTPGEPNIAVFPVENVSSINNYDFLQGNEEEIWITNGIRKEEILSGINDDWHSDEPPEEPPEPVPGEEPPPQPLGPPEDNITIEAGDGVSNEIVDLVREHISYSLTLYRALGFGEPAKVNNSVIKIRVVLDNEEPSSSGLCSDEGEIIIRIGYKSTKEGIKVTGEHELMHAFQFKKRQDGNGGTYHKFPQPDLWWAEGQAELFGILSMLGNYKHMTMRKWMNMSRNISSINWWDHYRYLNKTRPFIGWTGSDDHYMAACLFNKFLYEEYGLEKLMEVYNLIRFYGMSDSRNVYPMDALVQVLKKNWTAIYAHFLRWLLLEAPAKNGVPTYTPNVKLTYEGKPVGDTKEVKGSGAAVIEQVEIKNSTAFDVKLNYSGKYSDHAKWSVQVLIFYEDGSNSSMKVPIDTKTKSGKIRIDPLGPPKKIARIWVVKGIAMGATGNITMEVTPANSITLNYNNKTVGDTKSVEPNKKVYEIININGLKPFSIKMDLPEGAHKWRFTINRVWDNGTITSETIEVDSGIWFDYLVDPVEGDDKLQKVVVIKENLNNETYEVKMSVVPQVKITYNGDGAVESALIKPLETLHEIIDIKTDQPFFITLNLQGSRQWIITVKRYWENGTITEEPYVITDGSSFSTLVYPAAKDPKLKKVILVKENLGTETGNVTMLIAPITILGVDTLIAPFIFGIPYAYYPVEQQSIDYGFFIEAYCYLDTDNYEYEFHVNLPTAGGYFDVIILDENLEEFKRYEGNQEDFLLYIENPEFPPGIYYFSIQVHNVPYIDAIIDIIEIPI
ncbi:MAG: hypothetical protein GF308_18485 [Candidatus Heimdallarchaeota archaeon]|nr:hypothetical protein [Candidatus Heimdallarchaeota archaeon]